MHRPILFIFLALLTSCSTVDSPGAISLAETLILHELSDPDSYMGANRELQPFFVSVDGRDLPPESISRLG